MSQTGQDDVAKEVLTIKLHKLDILKYCDN